MTRGSQRSDERRYRRYRRPRRAGQRFLAQTRVTPRGDPILLAFFRAGRSTFLNVLTGLDGQNPAAGLA